MLNRFAHFWLILSLLFAPLQYALAGLNQVVDVEHPGCQMEVLAKTQASAVTSVASSIPVTTQTAEQQDDHCECCSTCESSCDSCLHFTAMLLPVLPPTNSLILDRVLASAVEQASGINASPAFRPPRT